MNRSITLQWLTNIPTPYRNHRYETMRALFPAHGIDFEVLYMARTEPDRHWNFDSADLRYPHKFFRGAHPVVDNLKLHFNPGLLYHLRYHPADILVVGGISAPTLMLAPLLARARTMLVLGSESNNDSARRRSGLAAFIKRSLLERYSAFITPGGKSPEYLTSIDPSAAGRPMLRLPNLVDRSVFSESAGSGLTERDALRARLGVEGHQQLWICPARLEEFKGLVEFVELLEGMDGVKLVVAGEGSLRSELESMIAAKDLPVSLLGQQSQRQVVDLYRAADLFVLPSLRDPSPLSPVEAAAASLPLFLSVRAGNVDEVLKQGINGWQYFPGSREVNRKSVREIAGMSREALQSMGRSSLERFSKRFDSVRCVEELAIALRQVHSEWGRPR